MSLLGCILGSWSAGLRGLRSKLLGRPGSSLGSWRLLDACKHAIVQACKHVSMRIRKHACM